MMAMVFTLSFVNAQDADSFRELRERYWNSSEEARAVMDSIYSNFEESYSAEQVKTIGGIPFGISREKALVMLRNKFGEPEYTQQSTTISFLNIKYANKDFDAVHFLFQSDGVNSYLNACIFIIDVRKKEDVFNVQDNLYKMLSSKYQLFETVAENGFMMYGGGVSPLWDGHWYSLDEIYMGALHIDVIQYESELAEIYGNKYAVRLIYGPYNYIKEEF